MRKLGIILAVMIAATLGYSGTASADGHENLQEPVCDTVLGSFAEGAAEEEAPFDDTAQGAQDDCNESFEEDKLNLHGTLCGLEQDFNDFDPEAGQLPAGVHDGLDGLEDEAEANEFPDIVDFEHPCGTTPTTVPPGDDDDGDDDDAEVGAVQRNNATADGGLPRTGGELFAGAGFGLMSLGALVRRFLP